MCVDEGDNVENADEELSEELITAETEASNHSQDALLYYAINEQAGSV